MVQLAERTIQEQLRSAARLEPDRLPGLKALGTEWAANAEALLAGRYTASPRVEFAGAPTLFEDRDVASTALLATIGCAEWKAGGFALVDGAFADVCIDALFGGDGAQPPPAERRATPLDLRLASTVLEALLEAGNATLASAMPVAMRLEALSPAASPAALVEAVTDRGRRIFVEMAFRLTAGARASTLRIALPEAAVALHRRKLNLVPDAAVPQPDEGWARGIQEQFSQADMPLRALLDERQTTLGEIASLAVGQTIVLDAHLDSLLTIECEEQRLFRGRMGRDRDSYVVRIEEAVDPTQEFIDDILSD